MRNEVRAVLKVVELDACGFWGARKALDRALAHRAWVVGAAERRLEQTERGLGLRNLKATPRHRRIGSTADAVGLARRLRAEPRVVAAAAYLAEVRELEGKAVSSARHDVALRTERMLSYGDIGEMIAGLDAGELKRGGLSGTDAE